MFDTSRMIVPADTTLINGIGTIHQGGLHVTSDGVNYEKKPDTNLHNENAIQIFANRDDFFNDDTTVDFVCSPEKCELTIAVDSEVGTALYNQGQFQLVFDRARRQWGMKAFRESVSETAEWKFCSPNESLGHVVTILRALAGDTSKETRSGDQWVSDSMAVDVTLSRIADSIERGSAQIVAGVSMYTQRNDCHVVPPSHVEYDNNPYSYMPPDF